MAEASKGSYLLFATESEDQKASDVFKDMAEDMERHVKILESRRDYLGQHNQLYQDQDQDQDQEQGGKQAKKKKDDQENQ